MKTPPPIEVPPLSGGRITGGVKEMYGQPFSTGDVVSCASGISYKGHVASTLQENDRSEGNTIGALTVDTQALCGIRGHRSITSRAELLGANYPAPPHCSPEFPSRPPLHPKF